MQDVLPLYRELFSALPQQMQRLRHWKKKSERFTALLADWAIRARTEHLPLDQVLLLPVQRIPK